MEQAKAIQEKKKAEHDAAEAIILAELVEKHGLTREALDEATTAEQTLSKSETGISTLVEALDFYDKSELTLKQFMFLAIGANSRANAAQNNVVYLQSELKKLESRVDNALVEAKEEVKVAEDKQMELPLED
jgi:hypothetical protein